MELITALEQFLAENVKGVSIAAQTVLAYASRPPNSDGASADGRSQPSAALPPSVQTPPDPPWVLDTEAFQVALDNALKDNVAGYVAQLRQAGQVVFTKTWEYAKRPPQDGRLLWRTDVPMHVASVSKLMTAMAMTVLMGDKISPDDSIIGYLPEYWTKTKNIQLITFRDLFNHTSGLSSSTEPTDFYSMKAAIAGATDGPGNYNYQNVNYGLFRIILAVMNGNIKNNSYFGGGQILTNDQFWDATTISAYNQYLQANVFKPSGVGDATLDQPSACALAYRRPDDINPGWNSGSMFGSCGCDGWHLGQRFAQCDGRIPPGQRHSDIIRRGADDVGQRLWRGPA